jgi:hypothetical protein
VGLGDARAALAAPNLERHNGFGPRQGFLRNLTKALRGTHALYEEGDDFRGFIFHVVVHDLAHGDHGLVAGADQGAQPNMLEIGIAEKRAGQGATLRDKGDFAGNYWRVRAGHRRDPSHNVHIAQAVRPK